MDTPAGAVRDPVLFQNAKNVKVANLTEAVEIDRPRNRVNGRILSSGQGLWFDYDRPRIATGAFPIIPRISGVDKKGVFTLHSVEDAEGTKALVAENKARDVVIGGGLIGLKGDMP